MMTIVPGCVELNLLAQPAPLLLGQPGLLNSAVGPVVQPVLEDEACCGGVLKVQRQIFIRIQRAEEA